LRVFKFDSQRISGVLLLVEWSTDPDTGTRCAQVLDAPDHIQKFLGNLGMEKHPVAKNFEAMPRELGRMMRAIQARVRMDSEVAKAEQEKAAA